MSTYVFMRILESAPARYDAGIRMLTLGRLGRVYSRLVSHVKEGQRVLDVGCGTGTLALLAAGKGARVKGFDINPQMLEIAKQKAPETNAAGNVEFAEMGVAELGREETDSYDVVMSGLCFSELSEDESAYALREIKRILKTNGLLLIADEAKPGNVLRKIVNWIVRIPLVAITYLVTQTTTRAVEDLPQKITHAGFQLNSVRFNVTGSFIEVVGLNPEKA